MKTNLLIGGVLGLVLVVAGCGSATVDPGGDSPVAPTTGTDAPDDLSSGDEPDDLGDGPPAGDTDLLEGTVGGAPFYIDSVGVTVAESHPVQLFLDVSGNAPTPAHTVAYTVEAEGDTIAVHITTQAGPGMAPQVLQPHSFVIPLGRADLPVTVDVNDGEFTETVEP